MESRVSLSNDFVIKTNSRGLGESEHTSFKRNIIFIREQTHERKVTGAEADKTKDR